MTDEPDGTQPDRRNNLQYHHIKSSEFRVIHVDGGVGGITPRGFCHISLYSERSLIPRVTVRDVTETGELTPERTVESLVPEPDRGIVRELEIGLLFNEQTAIELRDWLSRRIDEYAKLTASAAAEEPDEA